jgi:hypothetical protein
MVWGSVARIGDLGFVVCCVLFVVCCLLFVVCCLLCSAQDSDRAIGLLFRCADWEFRIIDLGFNIEVILANCSQKTF